VRLKICKGVGPPPGVDSLVTVRQRAWTPDSKGRARGSVGVSCFSLLPKLKMPPAGHTRIWAGGDFVNKIPTQLDGVSAAAMAPARKGNVIRLAATRVDTMAVSVRQLNERRKVPEVRKITC